MTEFTLWDILRNLLLATRWTVVLAAASFVTGSVAALMVVVLRICPVRGLNRAARAWIEFFQGTPLLMQLFLIYFGLPILGLQVDPWAAALIGLTLSASAYLGEIWRGAVAAVPAGQWEAARALGLHFLQAMRLVILPQAVRIALPPTVGFLGVMVKSTALCSIIGFSELMRTANLVSNATFQPMTVFGLTALIYIALCWPINALGRRMEGRLSERA